MVVAPTFPNTLTPDANVDEGIIASLATMYQDPTTSSPAQGKVDPHKLGVEGHSAGGLATTMMARANAPGAVVLFDPVDANDAGASAYAGRCGPLLVLFAQPSSCNNQEEWQTFATQTTAQATMFSVAGSTHCDGENHDCGVACGLACGGAADATRQDVYARYATAFFLANLAGDTQAAAALAPSVLAADTAIANVRTVAGSACSAVSDGGDGGTASSGSSGGGSGGSSSGSGLSGATGSSSGATGTSSGGFSGATTSPSSSGSSGSSTNGDAGGDAPASGCSCDIVGAARAPLTWGLAPLALFALRWRRRRSR